MRTRVLVERAGRGFRLRLTASQHWLLVNALAAFLESTVSATEVELVLGPAGGELDALLAGAEPAESGSRLVLDADIRQAHALHALLMNTPARFATEEAFHHRVGAFRENLLNLAAGLCQAVGGLTTAPPTDEGPG
ncbi:hypothetical protein [Actinacidiphila sp. bgisy144]|jgi:hypothetical protein|uniref:hypothetical protein n=1 Tax=Actinacidiphila sp. bgisy144 TaxID=3413791 RepID=UPI003EB700B1